MTTRPPAEVGMALADVDTPALIVDLDPLERNLKRMAEAAVAAGVALRPHAKTHKSAHIAHKQIALGAVGVCCQKVSEAEAMVAGGIGDVFVSNEIIGETKLHHLAGLARQAKVTVSVDHADGVSALARAAGELAATIHVMVDVDIGDGRSGVPPGAAALALARQVAGAPNLRFAGLQAYKGSAQHTRDYTERRGLIADVVEQVRATRDLLAADGLECGTISGAGTGTYEMEAESAVYTEIQPGSYVFMDVDYAANFDRDGKPFAEFEHSLFVLATVMSRVASDRAMLDAGTKALNIDLAMPLFADRSDVTYVRASDEHGRVATPDGAQALRLGEKVRLIPGHCDPTVNLYDWYVAIRAGTVEAVWPVSARGAVL